jgi:hypothetical protein
MSQQLTQKKNGHSPLGAAMLKISAKFFGQGGKPPTVQTIHTYRVEDLGYESALPNECLEALRGGA